ncbi:MAG: CDP-diacylglycerol--serine O-phosphatidyltransferase [Paracoccaceae bacterium]|jgi:CDP-diacylglycerol--serine O-phosphatidyltransferase
MKDNDTSAQSEMTIVQLLPNLLTLAALCAGLTAIRFGFQGDFVSASLLILAASVIDGVDGKLARLLNSESSMGAELDSLADFLNFGVATPVLLYLFALQEMPRIGWIAVLMFAVCCVIRLARFNVGKKAEFEGTKNEFFVGVPAPAGALLILLPIFWAFLFPENLAIPTELICLWMIAVALLMISHIPTYSFKMMTISRINVKYFMLGFAFLVAALLNYLWATLVVLVLTYFCSVLWSWGKHVRGKRTAR